MIEDLWFYAVAIPAVLLTGISKGGFAGGIGLVAVPLMALTISPLQAAGIMLPILMVMDAIGTWAYRKSFDMKITWTMMPGAVIGIVIGGLTAGFVEDTQVKLIVGAIAFAFLGIQWRNARIPNRPASKPSYTQGTFWGTVAGYTSFVAHAGAPPFQIYVLPQKPDKTTYVATSVIIFALVNWIKLPVYFGLGMLAPANLMTSLVLLPLAPLGMFMGIKLHNILPEKPFYQVVYTLIFLVAVKLTWDGFFGV